MAANYVNSNFPAVPPQPQMLRSIPLPPIHSTGAPPQPSAGKIKIPPLSALRARRTEMDIVIESEDGDDYEDNLLSMDRTYVPPEERKIAGSKRVANSMATVPRTYALLSPTFSQSDPAQAGPAYHTFSMQSSLDISADVEMGGV